MFLLSTIAFTQALNIRLSTLVVVQSLLSILLRAKTRLPYNRQFLIFFLLLCDKYLIGIVFMSNMLIIVIFIEIMSVMIDSRDHRTKQLFILLLSLKYIHIFCNLFNLYLVFFLWIFILLKVKAQEITNGNIGGKDGEAVIWSLMVLL